MMEVRYQFLILNKKVQNKMFFNKSVLHLVFILTCIRIIDSGGVLHKCF